MTYTIGCDFDKGFEYDDTGVLRWPDDTNLIALTFFDGEAKRAFKVQAKDGSPLETVELPDFFVKEPVTQEKAK